MNSFFKSVTQIFKGALNAFYRFPASMACALAFAATVIFRIHLDWPQEQSYYFIFNCLNWSLAFGAIFSLALIAAAQIRFTHTRHFALANILGLIGTAVCFLVLYNFSGKTVTGLTYLRMTEIAITRSTVAICVSLLAFIIIIAYPKDRSSFSSAFFMTHKAFFIALIYGLVIWGGASGVARAFQYLLYNQMSSKVYSYIATLAGLLSYMIFIGYFPDFKKGEDDERREIAQRQPRFIEILFVYIMVPIALALTAVLIIWAGKTALSGMKVSFTQLSGIAAAYTLSGMWLSFMVSGHDFAPSRLYRRVYPVASLFILIFEAWAVIIRLNSTGLKVGEYVFIIIWIATAAGALLLLIQKSKSHTKIALIFCALAVLSVMPVIGYKDMPVSAQTARLEKLLNSQKMLSGAQIVPATTVPERTTREAITDAALYLARAQDAKIPVWLDKNLVNSSVFKNKFGFEQTFSSTDGNGNPPDKFTGIYLTKPPEAMNISGYSWVLTPSFNSAESSSFITVKGKNGVYKVLWQRDASTTVYSLKVLLDDKVLVEKAMTEYVNGIITKYPSGNGGNITANSGDLSMLLKTDKADMLLDFSNIDISLNQNGSINYYSLNLSGIYIKEN